MEIKLVTSSPKHIKRDNLKMNLVQARINKIMNGCQIQELSQCEPLQIKLDNSKHYLSIQHLDPKLTDRLTI